MNRENDPWEVRGLDRALKEMPPLKAPPGLARRVMTAIAEKEAARWYTMPWHAWPVALQALSMAVLLGAFGGVVFSSWHLAHAAGQTQVMHELRELGSGFVAVWRTFTIVFASITLVFKQIGTGAAWMIFGLLALTYAGCVGIGAACWRLAAVRS